MQNKVKIDIEDYKTISNRIIEGEKNGIGKEYRLNTRIVLFEGEYINGKKNGKGKDYYENRKKKFEGEYLKGLKKEGKEYDKNGNIILILEKNGQGKEYYRNKKVKFEGEYYNGKRWNGKGYDPSGKQEYELSYGKGYVKDYNYDGDLIFEGYYLDGERNGKGKEFIPLDQKDFNFGFINSNYKAKKSFKKNNEVKLIFEGEYLNGERSGKGKEYYTDGNLKFEGEYLRGKKNGKGKEYQYDKLIFEGFYFNGEKWKS